MNRKIELIVSGQATTDGDGVALTRILSLPQVKEFDPYLMLDSFSTDSPIHKGQKWKSLNYHLR